MLKKKKKKKNKIRACIGGGLISIHSREMVFNGRVCCCCRRHIRQHNCCAADDDDDSVHQTEIDPSLALLSDFGDAAVHFERADLPRLVLI